jgi:hypothetical protein
MLFAGHGRIIVFSYHRQPLILGLTETTAHSLAAAIGLLSIHENIQEDVFGQIQSVVGYDRDPVSPGVSRRCLLFLYQTMDGRYLTTMPSLTRFLAHSMKQSECSVSSKIQ